MDPYAPYLVPGRRPRSRDAFLAAHPGAACVQTLEQCLDLLQQPWDEVYLDHDLGGEVLVDHERPDCGMAVVRWLCEESRPHLRDMRFITMRRQRAKKPPEGVVWGIEAHPKYRRP